METKKIALACFVGGTLCCLVAFLFTPKFWYLGLLAGGAGGYLGYEFRQVCRSVPMALRRAAEGTGWWLTEGIKEVRQWLRKPHPVIYSGVIAGLFFGVYWFVENLGHLPWLPLHILSCFFAVMIAIGVSTMATILILTGNSVSGFVAWEKESVPETDTSSDLGYGQALILTSQGIIVFGKFFGWTLWKYVAFGVFLIAKFAILAGWHLFRLIHSQKRVLCAIDGTLGGTVSYLWLAQSTGSLVQQLMLVFFGGLLGAAFGVLNWEVVSKRLLHLTADPS